MHGLAWLSGAPNVERLYTDPLATESHHQKAIEYINSVVCTTNPALLPDGSNFGDVPFPQTDPHVCSKDYAAVDDYHQDLNHLIATCEGHTACSTAYCLKIKNGQQVCRFGFPKTI